MLFPKISLFSLILESPLFCDCNFAKLSTFSGVDVTVVDHNNKTVLDLLASHPSARTTEIRDLIFGRSCQLSTNKSHN